MRLILATADFSGEGKNIGTLNSWFISYNRPSGLTWTSINSSVDKGAAFSATAEIDTTNYELTNIIVKMGDTIQTGIGTNGAITISASGSQYSVQISSVTANVNISITTKNIATGEPDDGGSGGTTTPTTYTFTVNPTPSTATVTLSATGYTTVTGSGSKSITVASGTSVSWSVSASGYTSQNGTQIITSTSSKSVTLNASGGTGGSGTQVTLGTITDKQWISNSNGAQSSLTNWKSTDYITIPSGVTSVSTEDITAYRAGSTCTAPFAFYDSNKTFISAVPNDIIPTTVSGSKWRDALTVSIPSNAAYLRVCWTVEKYPHATTGVTTALTEPVVYWN